MRTPSALKRILVKPSLAVIIAGSLASAVAAEDLSPVQQNSLVRTYCAVCHTDAAKNGGLSLQHYDAAQADPPLAAMLLSKLRNGAMGAAGLGIPDKATRDAWIAATTTQAAGAGNWTVIRTELPGTKPPIPTASIVREVPLRKPETDAPLYRLTLVCRGDGRPGEMQLAWVAPTSNKPHVCRLGGRSPWHRPSIGRTGKNGQQDRRSDGSRVDDAERVPARNHAVRQRSVCRGDGDVSRRVFWISARCRNLRHASRGLLADAAGLKRL